MCKWKMNDDDGYEVYETECSQVHTCMEEPLSPFFLYCPYCGEPITKIRKEENE